MLGEPLTLHASSGRWRATRGCPTGVFGGSALEGAAPKWLLFFLSSASTAHVLCFALVAEAREDVHSRRRLEPAALVTTGHPLDRGREHIWAQPAQVEPSGSASVTGLSKTCD